MVDAKEKPITGRQVTQLRTELNITTDEMAYMLGVNKVTYHKWVGKEIDEPVPPPTALLIRLLYAYPDLNFMPKYVWPTTLFEVFSEDELGLSRRDFAVMMGNHSTAMQRWDNEGAAATPQVKRLATVVKALVDKIGAPKALAFLRKETKAEGITRDNGDVFFSGSWKPETVKQRSDRLVKERFNKGKSAKKALIVEEAELKKTITDLEDKVRVAKATKAKPGVKASSSKNEGAAVKASSSAPKAPRAKKPKATEPAAAGDGNEVPPAE